MRERLDASGAVLVPLDEASVRAAVQALLAEGVQAIAVCLLFSFLRPAHEERIAAIIAEMAPGLPVFAIVKSVAFDPDAVGRGRSTFDI